MIAVYQPAVPIRAAIVSLDVANEVGRIDVEHFHVLGVQAQVMPAERGKFPAVRHEVIVWCERYDDPRPLLDIYAERQENPDFREELVVMPTPDGSAAFEAAIEAAKRRLVAEFEKCRRLVAAAR